MATATVLLAVPHRAMTAQDRVFAKCAWRLIPLMALLYLVNYIDRTNVGFAALTMNADLGFSPSVYGFGAGVLFVGYLLFQVPANLILDRIGTRRWIFTILLAWGALSAATAFVRGPLEFYAVRFLLGVAEAGFFPGMMYYLTLWFPQAYRARFAAWFVSAIPLSVVVGGPLSGLILGLDGIAGLHGWQWVFLIEGIPASLLAFAVLKFLPDEPVRARWLTPAEKHLIGAELAKDTSSESGGFWHALRDARVLALVLAGFGQGAALYVTSLWLPQIVQAMGYSNLVTGFLVAVPYLVSTVAVVVVGYSSDRHGDRIWHIALPWLLAALGFVIASYAQNEMLVLLGLTFAVIGPLAVISPVFMLASSFVRGSAAAGAIALLNTGASFSGFVAPAIFGVLRERTGGFAVGMIVLAVALATAAMIVLALGRAMAARKVRVA
jgi:ACS family tartrate transporter-like MFS transporter